MRKLFISITILLIMVMLALTACAPATPSEEAQAPAEAPAETAEATAEAPTETAAETPSADSGESAASGEKPVIGFLINQLDAPYPAAAVEYAQKRADELGAELIVADAQTDTQKEADQMLNLISQNVDVICVCPIDTVSIIPSLDKAKEAGIPVVTFINDVEEDAADLRVTYVGCDLYEQGVLLGQRALELYGESGGNVVEILGTLGSSGQIQRTGGFDDTIDGNDKITVLDSKPADWSKDKAMSVMEAMLTNYDSIDIVFTNDFGMAQGAVEAISSAGRTDEMKVFTVAVDDTTRQMIADGQIYCSVNQAPDREGAMAIDVAMDIINGDAASLPTWTKVDMEIIDGSNVGDFVATF